MENFDDSVADPTYKPPPPKNNRGQDDVTDDEYDIGEPMDEEGDAAITPPPPPPPPPPKIPSTLPAPRKIKNRNKQRPNVRFHPTATVNQAPPGDIVRTRTCDGSGHKRYLDAVIADRGRLVFGKKTGGGMLTYPDCRCTVSRTAPFSYFHLMI